MTFLPHTAVADTHRLPPRAACAHDRGPGGRDLGRLGRARVGLARSTASRRSSAPTTTSRGFDEKPSACSTPGRRSPGSPRARRSSSSAPSSRRRRSGTPSVLVTLRRDGGRDLRRARHARHGRRLDGARARRIRLRRSARRASESHGSASRSRSRTVSSTRTASTSKARTTELEDAPGLIGRTCSILVGGSAKPGTAGPAVGSRDEYNALFGTL